MGKLMNYKLWVKKLDKRNRAEAIILGLWIGINVFVLTWILLTSFL
jgi:hypothetical protein